MTDGNASQFVIYQSDDGQIKLDAAPTCREFRQVRTEGTREVARTMAFYAIRATMVTVPIDFSNEPSAQRISTMEAIRNIQTVMNGEVHLRLPQQFWGQEVEIIVLPAPQSPAQSPADKRSLRGRLKSYAKPELIAQEQEAWQTAAGEKHGSR